MSCDCCVALPRGAMGCLQFVIVVFPDHTNLLFRSLLLWGLSKPGFCGDLVYKLRVIGGSSTF